MPRSLVVVLLTLAGPTLAEPVCAPLRGTAAYSQCINDLLSGNRTETRTARPTPQPVPPVQYLAPDGTLEQPEPGESLEARGIRELDQATRNSDVRTNLLRQQIQRDMRQGVHGPPPLPGKPQPLIPGRSWP